MRKSDEKTAQEGGNCTNKLPDGGTQSINYSRRFLRNRLSQGPRLFGLDVVNIVMEKGIDVLLTQMTSQVFYLSVSKRRQITCISVQAPSLKESKRCSHKKVAYKNV